MAGIWGHGAAASQRVALPGTGCQSTISATCGERSRRFVVIGRVASAKVERCDAKRVIAELVDPRILTSCDLFARRFEGEHVFAGFLPTPPEWANVCRHFTTMRASFAQRVGSRAPLVKELSRGAPEMGQCPFPITKQNRPVGRRPAGFVL